MKRVGILGGTFNPPHIGHFMIANEVLHALSLDEVRLMPNAIPPHKVIDNGASDDERIQMLQSGIKGIEGLCIETIELKRGGVSYTYDTMKQLCELEPNTQFYFIVGGDSIDSLHTWYRIEELLQLVKFVGVNRPNAQNVSDYPVEFVEIPTINLSSTLIRERLKEGKTVRFLVPIEVENFIRKERLYGARG